MADIVVLTSFLRRQEGRIYVVVCFLIVFNLFLYVFDSFIKLHTLTRFSLWGVLAVFCFMRAPARRENKRKITSCIFHNTCRNCNGSHHGSLFKFSVDCSAAVYLCAVVFFSSSLSLWNE